MQTQLEEEYINDFPAPFIKGARIRMACRFLNEYHIKENDTLLLVNEIEHIYLADQNLQHSDGWLHLEEAETVTINGLDGYAKTQLIKRFPYARPKNK